VVAVGTPAGVIVLAGQAIETCAELEVMIQSGELNDAGKRIVELEPVAVVFSHDHRQWLA
jgi:hypothetical protein